MSQTLDEIDKWIKTAKKIVLFKAYACKKLQRRCKGPLPFDRKIQHPGDRGAAHNVCNMNLRIKPKQDFIPVVFHDL